MRARVPKDVPLLVELGSRRPGEVAFEAKTPYNLVIVITNGKIKRKFLHINRRASGMYVAHGMPGGLHESYHSDGKRHYKGKGIDEKTGNEKKFIHKLPAGVPLDRLTGFVRMQNATAAVSDRALKGYARFLDSEGPFDRVVYLDNRSLPEAINYEVILVEPFRHATIPFLTDWPVHLQLFTRCLPWIALLIYEQWPKQKP